MRHATDLKFTQRYVSNVIKTAVWSVVCSNLLGLNEIPNRKTPGLRTYTLIKIICGGGTLRNLGFYLYLLHVYRFLMLNNRFTIRRPIHRFILRVFIPRLRIFKLKIAR